MVKYPQAVLILARQYRVPARVIQDMVMNQVLTLPETETDGLITIAEAADLVGRSERTIKRWIEAGAITIPQRGSGPGPGGRVFLNRDEVLAFGMEPLKPGPPRKVMSLSA